MTTAALASALASDVMFLALRTRISERRAAAACLVLGFATPVWSVAADAVWPHTVTLLGIAGMAWAVRPDAGGRSGSLAASPFGGGCTPR